MAVFTPVAKAELSRWLEHFAVGTLLELEGIGIGIENSNFFVHTSSGSFVLTLFERLADEELPFYLELMRHLGERGVPCPVPQPAHDGALSRTLNGKPAALVSRLPGRALLEPHAAHCSSVARTMAMMHLAAADFTIERANPRDMAWWHRTVPLVAAHLDQPIAELLADEVATVSQNYGRLRDTLPTGPVHADLFRDNVLFDGDDLGGVIDFYFAGIDSWLFDIAVAVNDWCISDDSGVLDAHREHAFLQAYASVRPFTLAEKVAWPWALRAAALRFWLSRLADVIVPRSATLLTPHDPRHFERIVMRRRAEAHEPVVALPIH